MHKQIFHLGALRLSNVLRGLALSGVALLGAACSGPTSNSIAGSSQNNSNNNAVVNNTSKFAVSAYGVAASPRLTSSSDVPKGGGRYMVGNAYKVAGNWYHPSENTSYDQTGTASWYGPNFHGRLTANGEIFDQFHLSGAHTTLPLPSYVRVKNLANGRSVVVRLNDRGPFAHNRLIDVSKRTAEVLGFINAGTAQVRVTYLGRAPVEGDDTRYLVGSIDAQGGSITPSIAPSASRPPSIISRQGGGLLGAFTSLFSYAEGQQQGEAIISDAHLAANAVAAQTVALEEWQTQIEGTNFSKPYDLGNFPNSEMTFEIVRRFAVLSSVEVKRDNTQNSASVSLVITNLKLGVQMADIIDLQRELGI